MTNRIVVNPFNTPARTDAPDLVSIASADSVQYSNPRSPMSNEPMVEVLCGTHDGHNFKVWTHIKDRLVIPHRG